MQDPYHIALCEAEYIAICAANYIALRSNISPSERARQTAISRKKPARGDADGADAGFALSGE
jgi:hypothetical protein